MKRFFYVKLALSNIQKNRRLYFPYLFSCIFMVCFFYLIYSLGMHKSLKANGSVHALLSLAIGVLHVFSVIFLFYTYGFLMKKRKKEIGLYNILGMEKKHIAKVLFFESLWLFLGALVFGLAAGLLLNKLMYMLIAKLLQFETLLFYIEIQAILNTIGWFMGIFLFLFLYQIFQIHLSHPIELLKGDRVGEKEPKTRWLLTLIGFVSLGIGYAIALSVKSPLAAVGLFFVAVLFVMIGTYALFTAGSIAILKGLKRNKRFYYQINHFVSVSGMIYRMKQNAAGLANICLLSTAVLVMFSSTTSLYAGINEIIRDRYPADTMLLSHSLANEPKQQEKLEQLVQQAAQKENISISETLSYTYYSFVAQKKDNYYTLNPNQNNVDMTTVQSVYVISLEDYNRIEGKNVQLEENAVLLFSENQTDEPNTIRIENQIWNIQENLSDFTLTKYLREPAFVSDYLVVDSFDSLGVLSNLDVQLQYEYGINFNNADDEKIEEFNQSLQHLLKKNMGKSSDVDLSSIAGEHTSFYQLYGNLLFIAIFLGMLCLFATVIIIYYKQVSEGYHDRLRFEILQKVGMSHNEVKQTIRSQILTVFFLPLLMAIVHISVAFPIITKMLRTLSMSNVSFFLLCTVLSVLVFSLIYALVYFVTARTYYKIVKS